MTYRLIEFAREQNVARIRFARPEALNAISSEMLSELDRALDEVERDSALRVLVLSGKGRAFCAGADLRGIGQDGSAGRTTAGFITRIQAVMNRVRNLNLPVVAGLNGTTTAGGLEFALCADIIVAAEGARIGDGHVNFGVIPGAGGAALLPRIVGPIIAKYLLFTGEALIARDLAHTGLLAKIYPDETFEAELSALAARIAEKSPLGLKIIKRLVGDASMMSASDALRLEIEANETYSTSEDMREGLVAFAEKRKPVFVGR